MTKEEINKAIAYLEKLSHYKDENEKWSSTIGIKKIITPFKNNCITERSVDSSLVDFNKIKNIILEEIQTKEKECEKEFIRFINAIIHEKI